MRTTFSRLTLTTERELINVVDAPDVLFDIGGLHDASQEVFWAISYDAIMQVRNIVEVARGGYHSVEVPIPVILSAVLTSGTNRFMVAHNHSSGDVTPTQLDVDLTSKIMAAANTCGLYFEDHVVLGPNKEMYSFADSGLLIPSPQLSAMAKSHKRVVR